MKNLVVKNILKKEMVDETEEVSEDFDSVVDDIMDQGKSREDAEKKLLVQ